MRKIYRHKGLSFVIADDQDVIFTVKFISDGNTGQTAINIPGPNDPEIRNSDSAHLGKGQDLRNDTTIAVSDVANLAAQEDEIRIQYLINDQLLIEHDNSKSEEERPLIILFIKFLAP